jgi:formamidopyrimidine-DNA glycosylase
VIELPEATVIGTQIRAELAGKQIACGNQGNSPHKFAFTSGTAEEYEQIFKGKTIGPARGHGSAILVPIEPSHVLVLGGGGERILYHQEERTHPKKRQLLLQFTDGTSLTVTVSGWGNVMLLPQATVGEHRHVQGDRIPPLSDGFTWEHFQGLFGVVDPESSKSCKFFVISEPGVWGIGNGCLQDILYHAGIHPRRRIVDLSEDDKHALYDAIVGTLSQMVELGGRESERDLYGNRGRYVRILDSKTKGQPCPQCATPIEKSQYLGGAIYYCPICQT